MRVLQGSIKFLISVILFFLFSQLTSAQQFWSLEDCINYALENNIDIKKQMLMVENRKADLLQSKLNVLPNLNAGGNHIYNWGQTVDRYTNTFAQSRVQSNNFYLSSNFTVFGGLQKVNTMKQNQLELMASQYDLDFLMDDISVAVAGYYLDILYNEEILAVAHEQLGVTKQQVQRMQKLVDAGSLAKGDLLNLEAQAATEELQVVEAENRLRISYLSLMQLIDYPVSEDFRIEQPVLKDIEAPSISITANDIFNVAEGIRPEIKSAEIRVESAQKGVAVAKSYQSPILSITGNWATGYSGLSSQGSDPYYKSVLIGQTEYTMENVFTTVQDYEQYNTIPWSNQMKDNQNKSVGLTLQVPIFNGWQVRTNINKAKLAHADAEYTLEQERLNLEKKIQQAYADAVAALNNFTSSRKNIHAQQEAFKYAEQKFDVGIMNSVEYNETKKDLTRAESELLQAKYRFIYTTTILDFYMGNPLKIE